MKVEGKLLTNNERALVQLDHCAGDVARHISELKRKKARKDKLIGWACMAMSVLVVAGGTYGLALWGDEMSLWIWKDLLGVLK